jgi:hypothetical protein
MTMTIDTCTYNVQRVNNIEKWEIILPMLSVERPPNIMLICLDNCTTLHLADTDGQLLHMSVYEDSSLKKCKGCCFV